MSTFVRSMVGYCIASATILVIAASVGLSLRADRLLWAIVFHSPVPEASFSQHFAALAALIFTISALIGVVAFGGVAIEHHRAEKKGKQITYRPIA